jgi:RsiW-degrading membrane proteinase PrsW (M82 family)
LLAVLSIGAALTAFALAALMLLYMGLQLLGLTTQTEGPAPIEATELASAIVLAGMLFLPAAYYSIQHLRGKEITARPLRPLKVPLGILLFLLWIGASALAEIFFNNKILQWFTPPLYLMAIGVPVYLLVRLTAGGLNAGSPQRTWGVFSTSMSLGISFSLLAEGTIFLVGLIGAGMYIGFHPELLTSLRHIKDQLSNASSPDQALALAGPWLDNPFAFILALLFFSGFTPVIEETAKSLATWTVFDRLESSAQGFALGALSGAGFGLLESLLASAAPDSGWASTLLVRGGSTMMHIMAASLTGWGIASFRLSKRPGRMVGTYALAMLLHSLWNACVMLIVFGGVRLVLHTGAAPDILGLIMASFGVATLLTLCLAIPLALGMINWRFRAMTSSAPIAPPGHLAHSEMVEDGQRPSGGMEGVK